MYPMYSHCVYNCNPRACSIDTPLHGYLPVGLSLAEVASLRAKDPAEVIRRSKESMARQVEAILREFPEVRYTLTTINTGNAQGHNQVGFYIRLVDRKDRTRNATEMSVPLRERLSRGVLDDARAPRGRGGGQGAEHNEPAHTCAPAREEFLTG